MRPIFIVLSSIFILCTIAVSCKFNPNLQGKGTDFVQGIWEEDSVEYQGQLLEYTTHKFTFTCDSVYVVLNTVSKVNTNEDNCFNNGNWNEYAKGVYKISNDTLFVYSTFTQSDYKQKLSGCYRIGQYLPIFIVKKHTADSLYLQGLQEHLPVKLRMKQKTTCVPKPL
ncbi:MAG: fumarate hydratase [Sphingobacteriaceae bacterium]|jgi:hypothetical protein|nr:fumarate hydratase [Sphingobacteriaceae bacterium]